MSEGRRHRHKPKERSRLTERLGHEIRQTLERRFGIGHAILQFEAARGPVPKAEA